MSRQITSRYRPNVTEDGHQLVRAMSRFRQQQQSSLQQHRTTRGERENDEIDVQAICTRQNGQGFSSFVYFAETMHA